MNRNPAFATLAGLLVWTSAIQAQPAFTIKLKESGEGDAVFVKKSDSTVSKVTVADGDGKILVDQRETKTEVLEYKETVLKRAADTSPTKREREYTKVQSGKDDKTEDGALQGKTVIIEKKADQFLFTYKDGEAVAGAAKAALMKSFSKKSDNNAELEKLVLPKKAVKVGDSWKIEMPLIVKEIGKDGAMELDGAKSTGQGTLVKAYKKDGRQFGEMKFKLEMPMTSVGEGKGQLKFTAGAKIVMDITLDACIDGTSETGTMTMKMDMTGVADFPQMAGATATLDVRMTGTQSQQEAPKK